jgi:hypothetical protein
VAGRLAYEGSPLDGLEDSSLDSGVDGVSPGEVGSDGSSLDGGSGLGPESDGVSLGADGSSEREGSSVGGEAGDGLDGPPPGNSQSIPSWSRS